MDGQVSRRDCATGVSRRCLYHAETRYTLIARFALKKAGGIDVVCFPCWINDDSIPQLLEPEDPLFDEVSEYVITISREAGLKTRYQRHGDAVLISSQ